MGNLGKHWKLSENTKRKMGLAKTGNKNPMFGKTGKNHPMFGKKLSEETRKKMSEHNLKNPRRYWLGKENPYLHSDEAIRKVSLSKKGKIPKNLSLIHSLECRKKAWAKISGNNNYNWQGGITSINFKIRNGFLMKDWKRKIFEQDDYRCMDCGERGGQLEADHIFPFSKFPRLRSDVNNGQTLCKNCHKQKSRMDLGLKYIVV